MMLDNADRRLLNVIQAGFPLTREPYADLARKMDITYCEVIGRIMRLKEDGIIRMIGPVVNSRSLGYRTTLVAMRVNKANLEKAEQVIASHPGVSHGYERDHDFNIWFTLAVPGGEDAETELQKMAPATGAEAIFPLPAVKLFKIGAYFDMSEDGEGPNLPCGGSLIVSQPRLSVAEKAIINELQQDLPLIPEPFTVMAERNGIHVGQFLKVVRSLQQQGIIRRFSASINHNHAGFTANALSCWAVPSSAVDAAGQKLASLKEISHCYERKTNPLWLYNLFGMMHCHSREQCERIAGDISRETGLADYALLFSTKEFKKTRVKYPV